MKLKLSKRSRGWLGNLLLLALIYWAVQSYQGRDAPDSGPAPAIDAVALDGKHISLRHYRGRPTLVYFWATWCHVCGLTRDSINAIAREHPVITIASQSGNDAEIESYIDEHRFDAIVINDRDNRLSRQYGVNAFPSIFIVDAEGNIDDVEIGLSSEWGLRFRLWRAGI